MENCPKCEIPVARVYTNSATKITSYICDNCKYSWAVKEKKMKYMICRTDTPNKLFESEHQAQVVAEKMARENRVSYYVLQLILKVTPVEVPVEVTRVE